jgi:hypothetical protein
VVERSDTHHRSTIAAGAMGIAREKARDTHPTTTPVDMRTATDERIAACFDS